MKTLKDKLAKHEEERQLIIREHEATQLLLASLPVEKDQISFLFYNEWSAEKGMSLFRIRLMQVDTQEEAQAILNLFTLLPHYEKKGTYHTIDPHINDPDNHYKTICPLQLPYYVAQLLTQNREHVKVQATYELSHTNYLRRVDYTPKKSKSWYGYDTRIETHTMIDDMLVEIEIPIKFEWEWPENWRVTEMRHANLLRWYQL